MKRLGNIDFLRAVAIIGVVITHILSYNLGATLTNTIWNYLHFVVPMLVFCSGYVAYQKYATTHWTIKNTLLWYKKRAIRLIKPYALWTVVHYGLWCIFPKYFSGLGLDYGWLPILFLELMLVTPLYLYIWKTKKLLFIFLIFLSTVLLLFFKPSLDFRIDMWLPWSAILLLSFLTASQTVKSIPYIIVAVCAFAVFIAGNILLPILHQPLTLTLHKYPPDLFYLSYGIGIGCILLLIQPHDIFQGKHIKRTLLWLSVNSYNLFFAHYIILDLVVTLLRHSGK